MITTKVPIKEALLDESFDGFNETWNYLLKQAHINLNYIYTHEGDIVLELARYFVEDCHPKFAKARKIDFAAAGRSLYMDAKTYANRLSQLGFNVDYPYPDKEISGPPSSVISKEDVIVAMSASGETESVVSKCTFAHDVGSKIIAATAKRESPLAKIPPDIILEVLDKVDKDEVKQPYPKAFTPLGTLSEFTNAVLWECFSRGLHECIDNDQSVERSFDCMKDCCDTLVSNAQRDLKTCLKESKENIRMLIANLILKYFSENTVHLYGRGKIFNLQIAPFEMRLRQMPHGYITSILNYAPKNRPVRRGQFAILSSGSGGLSMTAETLKKYDVMVAGLTSHKSGFWDLLDIPIYLPGRATQHPHDWERKQWEGRRADYAPDGIQFEINGCVFLESIFGAICSYVGLTEEQLKEGHASKKLE